jgi:hypothetical protein
MSFNSSESGDVDTGGIPASAGVIISAYSKEISPILRLLILYAVLGAICLPLLLAVFYFSTPRIRRTPLFMIVAFDILLGIGISCWMVTSTVRYQQLIFGCIRLYGLTYMSQLSFLFAPLTGNTRSFFIAVVIITLVSPWVIDLVLLLRLYAVFPIADTPRRTTYAVFAFTLCVKAARLGCVIANAVLWAPTVTQEPWATLHSPSNVGTMRSPRSKAALACDLMDHTYVQLVQ